MEEKEDHTGVESLDKTIKKLEVQTDTLRDLKSILGSVSDDSTLHVEDRPDSAQIHVILRADKITDVMKRLAWVDFTLQGEKTHPDNIEYNLEEDEYVLKKKFRTDR